MIWIAIITVAFGLYLLGDNRQPLDCYFSSISAMNSSIIRLAFLSVSFIVYSVTCAYFLVAICFDFGKVCKAGKVKPTREAKPTHEAKPTRKATDRTSQLYLKKLNYSYYK